MGALGFVSVFDQVLEGLPQSEQDAIFKSYISALDEDADTYRKDAAAWEAWANDISELSFLAVTPSNRIGKDLLD